MDINVKYEHIDATERALTAGIESTDRARTVLHNFRGQFQGGGFRGEAGDRFCKQLFNDISHLRNVAHYYRDLVSWLNQARTEMQAADERLKSSVR